MNKKKQLLLEIHLLYDYGINNLENKYNMYKHKQKRENVRRITLLK